MPIEHPNLYRIDGIFIDAEQYGHDDEIWNYFSYDGSFDDETFNEFIASLTHSPSPLPAWQQRYSWLVQNGLLDQYHSFVKNKAVELAEKMMREVHAVNPNFSIGMYQSPSWRSDATPNGYLNPLYLDFFKGWADYHVPILYGTDVYGGGNIGDIMELKPTNKPYFRFERRDTGENIFVYYSAGIMLSFYDSNYGQWNLETDVYRTALQTNGYWLWGNTFLTEQNRIIGIHCFA